MMTCGNLLVFSYLISQYIQQTMGRDTSFDDKICIRELLCLNATFNNIAVISCQSALLVEETRVSR
jgi:hypothetical protein